MNQGKFLSKNVLITGGASGIGEASAKKFAEEGANVLIADINQEKSQQVVNEIRKTKGECSFFSADISKENDVNNLISNMQERYGKVDVLFNNAGTILPKNLEDIETMEWKKLMDINLTSMFLCTKAALSDLKERQGKIVNMGSMNGLVGQQNNPAYSASKGAIVALTKSLAMDYAPFNVRINAICPAGVLTPLIEEWFDQQSDPSQMRYSSDFSHMLGRTASPEEISDLVLFLASEEASFITGQAIPIEGGATLGYGAGPKPEWKMFDYSN